MALHLEPLPSERLKLRVEKAIRHAADLARHIKAARAAGKSERAERTARLRKAVERQRIGAEALAVNVRAATGNHGKPKPR